MFGKILMFLGLRQAAKQSFMRRNGAYLAPVGGIVPALAWLAYQNREKLMDMYKTRVAPKISEMRSHKKTGSAFTSAAI